MKDNIEMDGCQAWHSGKGENDCPYLDSYNREDYWESHAGKRQRWMRGFRLAWQNNEIMMRRKYWPCMPLSWMSSEN